MFLISKKTRYKYARVNPSCLCSVWESRMGFDPLKYWLLGRQIRNVSRCVFAVAFLALMLTALSGTGSRLGAFVLLFFACMAADLTGAWCFENKASKFTAHVRNLADSLGRTVAQLSGLDIESLKALAEADLAEWARCYSCLDQAIGPKPHPAREALLVPLEQRYLLYRKLYLVPNRGKERDEEGWKWYLEQPR